MVHNSLLYEAVEREDKDITFLGQILEALNEKEKTEESKVKRVLNWIASKLCCGSADNEHDVQVNKEDELQEKTLQDDLQKLEDSIVDFSKQIEGKSQSPIQEFSKELDEMRFRISDLKDELVGEKKGEIRVWDTPNKEGNTALHLSIVLKNPEATSLLLEFGVDPNVQDSTGKTPLHLACQQVDIEQATKLVKYKVLLKK